MLIPTLNKSLKEVVTNSKNSTTMRDQRKLIITLDCQSIMPTFALSEMQVAAKFNSKKWVKIPLHVMIDKVQIPIHIIEIRDVGTFGTSLIRSYALDRRPFILFIYFDSLEITLAHGLRKKRYTVRMLFPRMSHSTWLLQTKQSLNSRFRRANQTIRLSESTL